MPRWRACAPRTNSPPQPEADTLVELRPALAKLAPLVHELKQRAELDVERATAAEAAAAADASKSAQLREQVAQAAADLGAIGEREPSLEMGRGHVPQADRASQKTSQQRAEPPCTLTHTPLAAPQHAARSPATRTSRARASGIEPEVVGAGPPPPPPE